MDKVVINKNEEIPEAVPVEKDVVVQDTVKPVEVVDTNKPVEVVETEVPKDVEVVAEQVDIDGVVYNIDANGNAVTESGEIKFTADDIKNLSEAEEPNTTSAWKDIITKTNIIPLDDEGKPIEYSDDAEGQAKYVEDVYNLASTQTLMQYQNNLFGTYPILTDVLNHLNNNNGDLSNFTPRVDFSRVELDKDNEEQLKNIVIQGRVARGESAEKAERYIDYLKNTDSLFDEATAELEDLKQKDAAYIQELRQAEQQQLEAEQQEAVNYWGVQVTKDGNLVDTGKEDSVYGVVKTGKLKVGTTEYTIPEKIRINDNGKVTYADRNEFFRYLYEPMQVTINNQKTTMTRHEYDSYIESTKRSLHDDVFEAYKRFVKYDTSQFIREAVKKEEVNRVKRMLTAKTNKHSDVRSGGSDKKIIINRN